MRFVDETPHARLEMIKKWSSMFFTSAMMMRNYLYYDDDVLNLDLINWICNYVHQGEIIIQCVDLIKRPWNNVDLTKIPWNNDDLIKIPWNDYTLINIPWIYTPLDHRLQLVGWYTVEQDQISSKERTRAKGSLRARIVQFF